MWDDAVWLANAVFSIHLIAGEGDGLCRALTLDAVEVDAYRLWCLAGVDDLDDDLVAVLVVYRACEQAVLSFLSGNELLVHGHWKNVGSLVLSVHLLNVVAYGLEHLGVVEPNEVRAPLPSVDMGEQWSVGGHVHDVSVAFKVCHEGSLVE